MRSRVSLALALVALLGLGVWRWLPSGSGPGSGQPGRGEAVRLPEAAQAVEPTQPAETRTEVEAHQRAPDPELDLHGIVVRPDGAPVEGAELTVLHPAARQIPGLLADSAELDEVVARGSSAADGAFSLRLEPGRVYDLRVDERGSGTVVRPGLYAGSKVRVVLQPACSIVGRVTGAEGGAPVAGARVQARPGVLSFFGKLTAQAETDTDGAFTLVDLPPESCWLSVEAPEHVRAHAQLGSIAQGEERQVDVALERGTVVHGQVTDGSTKLPLAGAVVQLDDTASTTTDADGHYELRPVPVGSQRQIRAAAPTAASSIPPACPSAACRSPCGPPHRSTVSPRARRAGR